MVFVYAGVASFSVCGFTISFGLFPVMCLCASGCVLWFVDLLFMFGWFACFVLLVIICGDLVLIVCVLMLVLRRFTLWVVVVPACV